MDAQAESFAPRASGHLSQQELDKLKYDIESIDIDNYGLRCIIGYQDAIDLPKVKILEYLQEYLTSHDLYTGPIL